MDKTVLIVDDEPVNVELLRDLLQVSGYNTLEATNGIEAVEAATRNLPYLILMDINMPAMNGLEAAAILKENARTKKIPLVAITSMAMHGDEERIRKAGFDDYLSKPIRLKNLVSMLRNHQQ